MLWQVPVDKNDGKPCETWELTRRSATTYSHVHYHTLKPRSRGQDKTLKKTLLHICKILCEYSVHLLGWICSLALITSLRTLSPSHLHLPSIPFQRLLEQSSGPTPEKLSNTTNVSEVSNTTGTPLDSIFLYHSETWSHKPPSQAPGLSSFRVNVSEGQVHVRQSLVDFQCFGKCLGTTRMANPITVEPNHIWQTTRHSEPSLKKVTSEHVLVTWPANNSWNQVYVHVCINQWSHPQTQQRGGPSNEKVCISLPQDDMTRKAGTCRCNLWASKGLSRVEDNKQHRLGHETIASSITCM